MANNWLANAAKKENKVTIYTAGFFYPAAIAQT